MCDAFIASAAWMTSVRTVSPPSMSSAVASRVSRLPLAVADCASRMPDGCGRSSRDSFANYDPLTSSWRTSQGSVLGDSMTFSETWPRAGMTRNGKAYQRVPLVRLTSVIASGLWPTPRAYSFATSHRPGLTALDVRVRGLYREKSRYWPTPNASNGTRGPGKPSRWTRHHQINLEDVVGSGNLNPQWVEWLMGYPIDWT